MKVLKIVSELPRRLLDARNDAFIGELAETNTANVEISHVAMLPATAETASDYPRLEFRLLLRPCYN